MNGVSRKDGSVFIKWPKYMAPYDKDAIVQDDMLAWCWPNAKLSFPDFLSEETHLWWEESLRDFMSPSSILAGNGSNMAGIWIDMNEPTVFETNELRPKNWLWPDNDQDRYPHFTLKCPVNRYDDPPYRTKNAFAFDGDDVLIKKARLSQKTLCMVGLHKLNGKEYLHYDVHNLYGHSHSIATFKSVIDSKY
jgi:alpha-glucosidase (family GH31 glycosyl hydrolase)